MHKRNVIKKYIYFSGLLMIAMFVVGCSTITDLVSQYALSENAFNTYLKKRIGIEQKVDITQLANASLTFNDLNATIGKHNSKKVALSGDATIILNSIIGDQKANMKLKMSAQPYFDNKQGAIFLKDITLDDYTFDSSLGKIANKTVLPYINSLLQFYFDNQPVYVLDAKNNPIEAVIQKTAKYINVENGQITFNNNITH